MIQKTDGMTKSMDAGGAITANSIVKFGSSDDAVVLAAAATDVLIGVSGPAIASGARGEIQLTGIAEIKLGGTVTRGDSITSDGSGLGIALSAAATIKSCIGVAMASGVSGDIIPVQLGKWTAVTA